MTAAVAGAGWHDVCIRWDISAPQAIVQRLENLPGQGSVALPGKKLFAERDRFGRWEHLLGPRNVLLAHTVDSPTHGLIRRLEVQAHLGDDTEDDLCPPSEFEARWNRLQVFMGMAGVLPVEDPVYVRVDPAVDVRYEMPEDGRDVLEALRYARWPFGWYAEFQGAPPYTTVAIKSHSRTIARAYCRNTKLRNGGPRWGKLRFERQQRSEWRERKPVRELAQDLVAAIYWGSVFGEGRAPGGVTRVHREAQTVKLVERVESGEMTTRHFEQLAGFFDVERLGLTERVYNAETARRRRALARALGIAVSDAEAGTLDASLDELLTVPRSAWDG